jgi:glycosyltransferase involved in cell wall biosynthesis
MISVHMTTFRRLGSGLLRRAVETVLAQTYADFELVICDDASFDGTSDYLRDVAEHDPRVKIVRNPRNVNSVAISLGRCLKASDPERPYVTWMFDDCTLQPHAFETLLARMDDSLDFVFGVTRVHNADGSVLLVGNKAPAEIRAGVAGSSILVPNGGILFRRDVFDRVGWYDANIVLRRSCDWDLFRRAISSGCAFDVIHDVLMDEFGGLQGDSLRNSFTTTFELMAKFARLRDAARFDLSLDAVLGGPIDLIPAGDWSPDEFTLIYAIFVEYYLSVGDIARAYRWAEKLRPKLPEQPFFLENLSACVASRNPTQSLMAAGALAAAAYWNFRETRSSRGGA